MKYNPQDAAALSANVYMQCKITLKIHLEWLEINTLKTLVNRLEVFIYLEKMNTITPPTIVVQREQ